MNTPGKLIIELYRAAQEMPVDEFQEFSMGLVKSQLSFDSGRYVTGEMTPQGIRIREFFLHNKSEEILNDYAAIEQVDPILKTGLSRPGSVVRFHSPTLYRDKKNLALRDFTKRYGNINGMTSIYTELDSKEMQSISVFRADEGSYFSGQECAMAAQVFPHLLEAKKINRMLAIRQALQETEQSRTAIARLDGALYYCGTGFRKLLGGEWTGWDSAFLPAPLVHELGRTGSVGYHSDGIRICSQRIGDLLFLRAAGTADIPTPSQAVYPEVLKNTYGLTPAETRVAFALLDGTSAKAVAQVLNVSPSTVRTQIKEIYAKLSVNTRARFIKLMLDMASR